MASSTCHQDLLFAPGVALGGRAQFQSLVDKVRGLQNSIETLKLKLDILRKDTEELERANNELRKRAKETRRNRELVRRELKDLINLQTKKFYRRLSSIHVIVLACPQQSRPGLRYLYHHQFYF
jgi:biopolymer transport protein ExbB/TolQ